MTHIEFRANGATLRIPSTAHNLLAIQTMLLMYDVEGMEFERTDSES